MTTTEKLSLAEIQLETALEFIEKKVGEYETELKELCRKNLEGVASVKIHYSKFSNSFYFTMPSHREIELNLDCVKNKIVGLTPEEISKKITVRVYGGSFAIFNDNDALEYYNNISKIANSLNEFGEIGEFVTSTAIAISDYFNSIISPLEKETNALRYKIDEEEKAEFANSIEVGRVFYSKETGEKGMTILSTTTKKVVFKTIWKEQNTLSKELFVNKFFKQFAPIEPVK